MSKIYFTLNRTGIMRNATGSGGTSYIALNETPLNILDTNTYWLSTSIIETRVNNPINSIILNTSSGTTSATTSATTTNGLLQFNITGTYEITCIVNIYANSLSSYVVPEIVLQKVTFPTPTTTPTYTDIIKSAITISGNETNTVISFINIMPINQNEYYRIILKASSLDSANSAGNIVAGGATAPTMSINLVIKQI